MKTPGMNNNPNDAAPKNNFRDGMNQNPEIKEQQREIKHDQVTNIPQTDCVMLLKGKMIVVKNGETTLMDHDITMENGTRVSSNGTVRLETGTLKKMKEGEYMSMKGEMFNIEDSNKSFVK